MKLIIVTIVALLAIANAQVSQVQNAGQVGNVGQIRQCTCNDQYNGFREFKEFTNQCFDQCRVAPTSELRSLLDSPVKIYPCLDHKVDMLHKMFDCLNGRLIQADSCTSETLGQSGDQGQSVSNQDFRQLLVQYMDPMFDQVVSALEILDRNNQHLARNVIGLGSCAPNCLLEKIKQARYFDISSGCIPRINGNQLQQHIQMCFSEMNLKNTIYKVCTCGVGVGANQLQQYCQQLNSVQFPQYIQGQMSNSMDFGMMGGDQQQFGQQQQQFGQQRFGQSMGLYPRGQTMRVNLAIQQEPGTPGSFFQGSTGGLGSNRFDQKSASDSIENIGFL